mgnify:CR=1 FL=1
MSDHGMPHTTRWQALLSERLSVNEASRLLARAQARYDLVERQTPELPPGLDRTQWRRRVLPALAVYEVLQEEGWGTDAALARVERLLWSTFDRERRIMGLLRRLPRRATWLFFRALMRGQLRWFYTTGTWQWAREGDRRVLAFDVTRCAIHEILTKRGAPELTSVFCAMDDRLAALLPASIRWRRTGTLADGKDCCDFRYERKGP